jgi:hypothetical protein
MKKLVMALFNDVNFTLNQSIKNIEIFEVQQYLVECEVLKKVVINHAKRILREEVARLMTRHWIADMSLRAKFRKNKEMYTQFLEKYMQHIK